MSGHGKGATRLAQVLYLWRTVNRLSLRDIAAQSGLSQPTIMRIEHGHSCDVETWMKLQAWLFERVGPSRPQTWRIQGGLLKKSERQQESQEGQ